MARIHFNPFNNSDIVDIKPDNMEVITAAEFHPYQCNTFVYSSSKGTIRLCDMRSSALCDKHSKRELLGTTSQILNLTSYWLTTYGKQISMSWYIDILFFIFLFVCLFFALLDLFSVRGARRPKQSLILLRDHFLHLRCQVQSQWTLHDDQRLPVRKDLGFKYGEQASRNPSGESGLIRERHPICTFVNSFIETKLEASSGFNLCLRRLKE